MTFLFYMMWTLVSAVAFYYGVRELHSRKKYAIPYHKVRALSWPAKQLLTEFNALPKANRPYTNMHRVVTALDVKHGVSEANSHFGERRHYYDGASGVRHHWNAHRCYYRGCKFIEYQELHDGMVEIREALEAQAHALKMASVSGMLDEVKELTQRMREESNLIETVTKEIT